jgi:glycosyltransferase involved in cell wall biosynthesis
MSTHPTVSIGIPVRNGQRYISQAIDSLLGQTFSDFEIVICDNASTDQTEQICRDYMSRDSRVRYYRNSRNLGPAGNHNKCFDYSQGKYFRWHAHDDMCAPTYLEKSVACLDENPDVVLAYPKTLIVDELGEPMEEYNFTPATSSHHAAERFASLVMVNHRQHRACEIFGLMRSSALRQTPLEGAYARGDSVLLVRMALLGRFVEMPDRLFLSRCHSTQSMQTMPSGHKSGKRHLTRILGTGPLPPPEWWDASRKGKANFPEWNLFKEYWISIGQAPLSNADRMRCRSVMFRWLGYNAPKLARDLIYATENLSNRFMDRVSADWADAEQFNERVS